MALKTTPWDPADNMISPEAEQEYLQAAFEDGDPAALGDIARARGTTQVAREATIGRETLCNNTPGRRET